MGIAMKKDTLLPISPIPPRFHQPLPREGGCHHTWNPPGAQARIDDTIDLAPLAGERDPHQHRHGHEGHHEKGVEKSVQQRPSPAGSHRPGHHHDREGIHHGNAGDNARKHHPSRSRCVGRGDASYFVSEIQTPGNER